MVHLFKAEPANARGAAPSIRPTEERRARPTKRRTDDLYFVGRTIARSLARSRGRGGAPRTGRRRRTSVPRILRAENGARARALASLVVIPPSCCIAPPSWPKGTVSLIQQKLPEMTLPFLKHGGIINSSWFLSIISLPS